MSNREPQTIGDIMKANHLLHNDLAKVRREFYYGDIFRLYGLLGYPVKNPNRFYNNVFDELLTYDFDLLVSHRDALIASCVRAKMSSDVILDA